MFAGFKKQTPTDVWSVRERLCLASSVLKSGDQNWVSVSRAIRPFGEPNRPQDWFSQKNCALQYSELLEKVETPKRKRGERGEIETPGESIVRKLTQERVEELRRLIALQQHKHRKVKEELIQVQSGQADDRLHEIWASIQEEKRKQQQDAENHQKWLVEREAANQAASAALRASKMVFIPRKPIPSRKVAPSVAQDHGVDSDAFVDSSQDDSPHVDSFSGEESQSQDLGAGSAAAVTTSSVEATAAAVALTGPPPTSNVSASVASNIAGSTMLSPTISTTHHSPLLNTLLRSSSSHASQTTTTTPLITSKDVSPRSQASTSPTITSLLTAPMASSLNTSMANLLNSALGGSLEHHHIHHHDSAAHIPTARPPITSPSQGAPTLLKLLDMPLGITGKLPPLPIVTTDDELPQRPLPPPTVVTSTSPSEAIVASTTMVTSSPIIPVPPSLGFRGATMTPGDVPTASSVVDVSTTLEDAEVVVSGSVKQECEAEAVIEEMPSLVEFVTEGELDIVGESTVETTNRDDSSDLLLDVGDVEEVVIGGSGNTSSLDLSLDVVGLSEEVVLGSSGTLDEGSLLDVLLTSSEKMGSVAVVEVTTAATTVVEETVVSSAMGSAEVVTLEPSISERDQAPVKEEVVVIAEKTAPAKLATRTEAAQPAPIIKKEEPASKASNVLIKIEVNPQPVTVVEPPVRAIKAEKTIPQSTVSSSSDHTFSEKSKAAATSRVGRHTMAPVKVAAASSSDSSDDSDVDSVQSTGTGDYGSTRSAESASAASARARSRRTRGRRGGRWGGGRSGVTHVPAEDVTTETSTEATVEESVRSSSRRGSQDTLAATDTPRRPLRGSAGGGGEPARSTRSRRDDREETVVPPETEERVGRLRGDTRRATPRGQQQPPPTSQKPAVAAATPSDRGGNSRDVDELMEALREDMEDDLKDDGLGRTESLPNSPASTSFSGDDPESVRDYKVWKKAIMLVWRSAANHKNANVFLHPVTEEMAPGYHSIVHRPMDLMTVKRHVETGATRTTAEFQRDIMLMFQNAIMYNNSDHDVYGMAIEMQREVCGHIQDFMATQLMVQSAGVVPPKTTRRETREHASKKGGGQESAQATPSSEKSASATPEPDNKRKRLISDSESVGGKTKKRRTRADD